MVTTHKNKEFIGFMKAKSINKLLNLLYEYNQKNDTNFKFFGNTLTWLDKKIYLGGELGEQEGVL
jgi:hypothetical protein